MSERVEERKRELEEFHDSEYEAQNQCLDKEDRLRLQIWRLTKKLDDVRRAILFLGRK